MKERKDDAAMRRADANAGRLYGDPKFQLAQYRNILLGRWSIELIGLQVIIEVRDVFEAQGGAIMASCKLGQLGAGPHGQSHVMANVPAQELLAAARHPKSTYLGRSKR